MDIIQTDFEYFLQILGKRKQTQGYKNNTFSVLLNYHEQLKKDIYHKFNIMAPKKPQIMVGPLNTSCTDLTLRPVNCITCVKGADL